MTVACSVPQVVARTTSFAPVTLTTQRVGSSRVTKACHRVLASCVEAERLLLHSSSKQLAVQVFPHSNVSRASCSSHAAGWSCSRQSQQNPAILSRKDLKIERGGRNGYHNWSDDFKATLSVRRRELRDALRWAGRRRDQSIDRAALQQRMSQKPATTRPFTRTSWFTRTAKQGQSPQSVGATDSKHGVN